MMSALSIAMLFPLLAGFLALSTVMVTTWGPGSRTGEVQTIPDASLVGE
jgi:hypothetical protein